MIARKIPNTVIIVKGLFDGLMAALRTYMGVPAYGVFLWLDHPQGHLKRAGTRTPTLRKADPHC
jgi:hypothetical protein